ncbi:MAG: 50S ribosomal protein L35 [Desulfobaccales bacterium]
MPKLKTHRGAAKRLKPTASGRLKLKQPGLRHLLTGKPRKRKRQLRTPAYVHPADQKRMQRLLPYL